MGRAGGKVKRVRSERVLENKAQLRRMGECSGGEDEWVHDACVCVHAVCVCVCVCAVHHPYRSFTSSPVCSPKVRRICK